jgi:hypothetical protein
VGKNAMPKSSRRSFFQSPAGAAAISHITAAQNGRRNVIFILTDDHRCTSSRRFLDQGSFEVGI